MKNSVTTASAGNRTRINCLEGSYAHHYTTDAIRLAWAGGGNTNWPRVPMEWAPKLRGKRRGEGRSEGGAFGIQGLANPFSLLSWQRKTAESSPTLCKGPLCQWKSPKRQRHLVFLGGHPSQYLQGPTLFDFSDQAGTGIFNVAWLLSGMTCGRPFTYQSA